MEFMPVVLAAGMGSRIKHLSAHYPKALLTMGNYPMVYYPLAMLERHGFTEAIIVTPRSFEDEIRSTLVDKCGLKIKLIFESINDSQLEDYGTAQTLRLVRPKIPDNVDVLVVSCDLITEVNLNPLFSMFRKTESTVTLLLSTVKENRDLPLPGVAHNKQNKEGEARQDVMGISEETGRLVIMESFDDMDDEYELEPRIFLTCPAVRVRSTMTDCHLYLLKRWTLDYLATHKDCEKMSSLKLDFLPHLVKKQFPSSKRLADSRTWKRSAREDEAPSQPNPASQDKDIYAFAEMYASKRAGKRTQDLAQSMSAGVTGLNDTDLDSDDEDAAQPALDDDVIRCYAFVQESGFCVRTNTLSAYCAATSQMARVFPTVAPHCKGLVHATAKVPKTAQVGPDCFIGEDASLGDKVVMKKSSVGINGLLHDKVKVVNSILMDQVEIGEGCVLMNSIICSGAVLKEKCEIKDSIVLPSNTIKANSKHTGEYISAADRLLE